MKRRRFLAALPFIGLAAPILAEAQPARIRHVGVLLQGGPHAAGLEGLRSGLQALGFEEGRNLALAVREGKGDLGVLATAATALEREGVELIVAFSTSITTAARKATARVPIVFVVGADPVATGLVQSIPKPGGRLTGVHSLQADLTAKRFEVLKELVPALRRVVVFYDPANPMARSAMQSARETARVFNVELVERPVTSVGEVLARMHSLKSGEADALFFVVDSMVITQDALLVQRANALKMASMGYELEIVAKGALAAYGLSYRDIGRLMARYVARILSGDWPADLPVEAASRVALAINLRTARSLGLAIPQSMLLRADEVIQ